MELADNELVYFGGEIVNRVTDSMIEDADMKDLDDDEGYYLVSVGEQLCYRYQVLKALGKGSFA